MKDVKLQGGYTFTRDGYKITTTSPVGAVVVKCVSIVATDKNVESFMRSLTVEQLKAMFK